MTNISWVTEEIVLWMVIGVITLWVIFLNLGPVAEIRLRGGRLPEASFGFSSDEFKKHLARLNKSAEAMTKLNERDEKEALSSVAPVKNGRLLYRDHLSLDSLFAVSYGVLLWLIIDGIWQENIAVPWLAGLEPAIRAMPVMFALTDLSENTVLARAVSRLYRDGTFDERARVSPPRWTTRFKWFFGALTLAAVVASLLAIPR